MCAGLLVCARLQDGRSPPERQLNSDRLSRELLFYAEFCDHVCVLTSQSDVILHLLDCRSVSTDGRERRWTSPQQGVAKFAYYHHIYLTLVINIHFVFRLLDTVLPSPVKTMGMRKTNHQHRSSASELLQDGALALPGFGT